jgi:hypothetical protein
MPAAILGPTEDEVFDTMWGFIAALFDVSVQPYIFKGFQNVTATPAGVTYVVISPGVKTRFNQGTRSYDALNLLSNNERSTQYSYQVDCYGPLGPDYADIVSTAWRTMWACDQLSNYGLVTPLIEPLFADEPSQLNIVNGEMQYEQRYMTKLYGQVNTVVGLPQDFFTAPITVIIEPPADLL